jgi:glucose dehydrogenase
MHLKPAALLLAILPACVCAASLGSRAAHVDAAATAGFTGAHFSPLAQITPGNVHRLGIAWVYNTGQVDRAFQDKPLVVGNRMFIILADEHVIALNPDSGRVVWKYNPHEKRTRVSRGLSWWPGAVGVSARLVVATADGHVIELDPATGRPVASFADDGVLNLRAVEARGWPYAPFGFTSPPAIYHDLIILGPSLQEGPSHGPPGLITAVNAITGRIVWQFHTTPQPGEPGNSTWGPNGWKDRSGPSAWGNITVDPRLGLAFVPVANPADSYYGADRPGTNLYANSVVALDAATGKLRWYFQFVHHDLWDTDTVSTALIDAWQGGKEVPAVAVLTKSALLFMLNRRTGKPIFGIRQQRVAQSDVPGEHPWPTEPYPTEPPPLARQSATPADVSTVTPASEAYCRKQFAKYRNEGPYSPFQLQPSLHFPSTIGGGNWGGTSYDPELNYIYVNTSDLGSIGRMVKAGTKIKRRLGFKPNPFFERMLKHMQIMPYLNADVGARFVDRNGYPCQQPPWGLLSAVSTRTGRIAWQVRLGEYPGLAKQGVPPTGTANLGGSLVTGSGVLFIGATLDGDFRAFDARTGKILWTAGLDGYGESFPVTYLGHNGKQYVVIAVGSAGLLRGVHHSVSNPPVRLVAFALGGVPAPPTPPSAGAGGTPHSAIGSAGHVASAGLPPGYGRSLVQTHCTICHGIGNIRRSRFTAAGWAATVRTMVNRGAPLNKRQVAIIVNYLAHNFHPAQSRQ